LKLSLTTMLPDYDHPCDHLTEKRRSMGKIASGDSKKKKLRLDKLKELLSIIQELKAMPIDERKKYSLAKDGVRQEKAGGHGIVENCDGKLEPSSKLYLAVLYSTVKLIDRGLCNEKYLDWAMNFFNAFKSCGKEARDACTSTNNEDDSRHQQRDH
jgi:hypothetical protein